MQTLTMLPFCAAAYEKEAILLVPVLSGSLHSVLKLRSSMHVIEDFAARLESVPLAKIGITKFLSHAMEPETSTSDGYFAEISSISLLPLLRNCALQLHVSATDLETGLPLQCWRNLLILHCEDASTGIGCTCG